jgi:histidine ammonia-lyase
MGTIGSRHAYQIISNVRSVLAIELICALQAVEYRGVEKMSPVTKALFEKARTIIPSITKDRVFSRDIENTKNWLTTSWQDFFINNTYKNPLVQFAV